MKTKKWTCAYDGTIKKLDDGRCAACGRSSKAESQRDAEAWDRSAHRPHTPTPFTVIVTNGNAGLADWRIHRAGCSDIRLEERKSHGHSWDMDGSDAEDVILQLMADQEADDNPYPRESFSVAPCAKAEDSKKEGTKHGHSISDDHPVTPR